MYVKLSQLIAITSVFWKPVDTPRLALLICAIETERNRYDEKMLDSVFPSENQTNWFPDSVGNLTFVPEVQVSSLEEMKEVQKYFCIDCNNEFGNHCEEIRPHFVNVEDDIYYFGEDLMSFEYLEKEERDVNLWFGGRGVEQFQRFEYETGFSFSEFEQAKCDRQVQLEDWELQEEKLDLHSRFMSGCEGQHFIYYFRNWTYWRHLLVKLEGNVETFEESGETSKYDYFQSLNERALARWMEIELDTTYDSAEGAYGIFVACGKCGPLSGIGLNLDFSEELIIEMIPSAIEELRQLPENQAAKYWTGLDKQLGRLANDRPHLVSTIRESLASTGTDVPSSLPTFSEIAAE
jgi:hypothetical protein